jgi:DNA-binding transcriptional ArsR family regulator
MLQAFNALADQNRLRILACLGVGTMAVGEIADALDLNQPQTSKHLAVLKAAGLVEVERKTQRRLYRIRAEGFKEIDGWLESYRVLWNVRFAQLDNVLVEILEKKESADESK